jgi:acetyltransferase
VVLDVEEPARISAEFECLMDIEGASGVLIQPMHRGTELFAGVKREGDFGHLILCGMGGIWVETLRDVSAGLAPLSGEEAGHMIQSLRGYPVFRGIRGSRGINEDAFRDILLRISALVTAVPEIVEMDLNPLIATAKEIRAVDVRIRIDKESV